MHFSVYIIHKLIFIVSANSPVFLQADFKEVILVHGIALQGTSPTAHYATLKYSISYQYNRRALNYLNKTVFIKFFKFD